MMDWNTPDSGGKRATGRGGIRHFFWPEVMSKRLHSAWNDAHFDGARAINRSIPESLRWNNSIVRVLSCRGIFLRGSKFQISSSLSSLALTLC